MNGQISGSNRISLHQVRDLALENSVAKLYDDKLPYHNFGHVQDTLEALRTILEDEGIRKIPVEIQNTLAAARFQLQGESPQAYQLGQAMPEAAANPAGGLAGAGVGLGLGGFPFDTVDASMPLERQVESFGRLKTIIDNSYNFTDRDAARDFFTRLTSLYKNWNYTPPGTPEYDRYSQEIMSLVEQHEGRPERRSSDRKGSHG